MRTVQGTLTLCKCLLGLLGEERDPVPGQCSMHSGWVMMLRGEKPLMWSQPFGNKVKDCTLLPCPCLSFGSRGAGKCPQRGRARWEQTTAYSALCLVVPCYDHCAAGDRRISPDWLYVLGIRNKTFSLCLSFPIPTILCPTLTSRTPQDFNKYILLCTVVHIWNPST